MFFYRLEFCVSCLSAIWGKLPHHLEGMGPALVVSDVAPALSTGV